VSDQQLRNIEPPKLSELVRGREKDDLTNRWKILVL
jgi:hypothetical protein